MACDPMSFSGVDSSKWECARDVVERDYGIRIDSDQGEASESGFTLKWSYDANAQTLEIQCTDKPFFVSCGMVSGRIKDTAAKCEIVAA